MTTTLKISAHETLEILREDADAFVVLATYQPHGSKPPAHLHPSQTEQFEVLEGRLRVDSAGQLSDHGAGSVFTIEPGTAHRMWNATSRQCTVRWTTTPALSTPAWFRGLARIQSHVQSGGSDVDRVLSFALLTRASRQVFRPVIARSPRLGSLVMAILAVLSRVYRFRRS